MPLTPKGMRIKRALVRKHGKTRGNQLFYSGEASGRLKGVKRGKGSIRRKRRKR